MTTYKWIPLIIISTRYKFLQRSGHLFSVHEVRTQCLSRTCGYTEQWFLTMAIYIPPTQLWQCLERYFCVLQLETAILHLMGRGQRYCETSCKLDHLLQAKHDLIKMLIVLKLRTPFKGITLILQEGTSNYHCKLQDYQWIWKFIKLYSLNFLHT